MHAPALLSGLVAICTAQAVIAAPFAVLPCTAIGQADRASCGPLAAEAERQARAHVKEILGTEALAPFARDFERPCGFQCRTRVAKELGVGAYLAVELAGTPELLEGRVHVVRSGLGTLESVTVTGHSPEDLRRAFAQQAHVLFEELARAQLPVSSIPQARPAAAEGPPWLLATLTSSMCEGDCPSFQLGVFSDGEVSYQGDAYVRVEGHRSIHLSPATMDRIWAAFADAAFFELAAADCQSTRLQISLMFHDGRRTKTLQAVCRHFEREARELAATFVRLADPERWSAGDPADRVVTFLGEPSAEVLLDGELLCEATPCAKPVRSGRHEVTFVRKGVRKRVVLDEGATRVGEP